MSFSATAHPNTLAGSRTLVVGGTAGLGAAVVSGVLANGGLAYISSSNADRVAAKVSEFKALYPAANVSGTAADMSDEATLEQQAKRVLEEAVNALGGPLDHLVYTAGDSMHFQPLKQIEGKTHFKSWNVRYLGPLMFAKLIAGNPGTYLKVESLSSITLTSGTLGHKPIPGVAHLVSWAGAIETLTRGLSIDLAPIRVNTVSPGAVYTELLASMGQAALDNFASSTLRKKVGMPEETAEAYLFCMRSAFMAGEVVKCDGGASLV